MTTKLTNGDYRRFSTAAYLLFRYIRLTPQLAIYLLIITLLPPMFDGPIWQGLIQRIGGQCRRTWWQHLLYVQNIYDPNNLVRLKCFFFMEFILIIIVISVVYTSGIWLPICNYIGLHCYQRL